MELSDLRKSLGQFNDETLEYIQGLFILARHWDSENGEAIIRAMMADMIEKGASTQEAAIDCFHFLRPKFFK